MAAMSLLSRDDGFLSYHRTVSLVVNLTIFLFLFTVQFSHDLNMCNNSCNFWNCIKSFFKIAQLMSFLMEFRCPQDYKKMVWAPSGSGHRVLHKWFFKVLLKIFDAHSSFVFFFLLYSAIPCNVFIACFLFFRHIVSLVFMVEFY